MKTPAIIEQHFHGAYGIYFNKCNEEELLFLSQKLCKIGIGGFFPTLVTDGIENINRQIKIIKVDVSHCQCPFLYACYEAITAYIIYLFAGYVNKDF